MMVGSSSATISAGSGSRPKWPTRRPISRASTPRFGFPAKARSSRPAAISRAAARSALSFMINGMLDFGDDDGISGFVGGGVGMARVKANNQRVFANAAPFLDDSRLEARLAGVRGRSSGDQRQYRRDGEVSLLQRPDLRYRRADRHDGATARDVDTRFRSHSLLGGITFNFGPPPDPPAQCWDRVTARQRYLLPLTLSAGNHAESHHKGLRSRMALRHAGRTKSVTRQASAKIRRSARRTPREFRSASDAQKLSNRRSTQFTSAGTKTSG